MMQRLIAITCFFLIAACGGRPLDQDPQLQALQEARAQWVAQAIHHYRFTIRQSCFCFPPARTVHLTVSDGEISLYSDEEGPLPDDDYMALSVDDLFAKVEQAILAPDSAVTVQYHPDYGFPVDVDLDWAVGAIDDEIRYIVSNFEERQSVINQAHNNLDTWQTQAVQNYRMTVEFACYGCIAGQFVVRVEDGEVVDSYFPDSSASVVETYGQEQLRTVDGWLDYVAQHAKKAADIEVEYAEAGWPRFIRVDGHSLIADDVFTIRVSQLTAE